MSAGAETDSWPKDKLYDTFQEGVFAPKNQPLAILWIP